jgi:hypothetical protein
MDQTIYGQAQARREGRQVPTSLDPFDPGRRRDRAIEDPLGPINGGVASGSGSNRGDKHRRHAPEMAEFGILDGPANKKRRTGNDPFPAPAGTNQSRGLMDAKVDGGEVVIDPRLAATAASGSMAQQRSASPQHAQNIKRDPNAQHVSASGHTSMMPPANMNHSSINGYGPPPVGAMSSASLSAGPQQPPPAGHLMPSSASGASSQQQPRPGASWGYQFPTGATPGMQPSENRNRYLAGMAAARN